MSYQSNPRNRKTNGAAKTNQRQLLDTSVMWRARGILHERDDKYLIQWEDNPATGEKYDPSWEPKRNANAALINIWKEEKRKQRMERKDRKCNSKDKASTDRTVVQAPSTDEPGSESDGDCWANPAYESAAPQESNVSPKIAGPARKGRSVVQETPLTSVSDSLGSAIKTTSRRQSASVADGCKLKPSKSKPAARESVHHVALKKTRESGRFASGVRDLNPDSETCEEIRSKIQPSPINIASQAAMATPTVGVEPTQPAPVDTPELPNNQSAIKPRAAEITTFTSSSAPPASSSFARTAKFVPSISPSLARHIIRNSNTPAEAEGLAKSLGWKGKVIAAASATLPCTSKSSPTAVVSSIAAPSFSSSPSTSVVSSTSATPPTSAALIEPRSRLRPPIAVADPTRTDPARRETSTKHPASAAISPFVDGTSVQPARPAPPAPPAPPLHLLAPGPGPAPASSIPAKRKLSADTATFPAIHHAISIPSTNPPAHEQAPTPIVPTRPETPAKTYPTSTPLSSPRTSSVSPETENASRRSDKVMSISAILSHSPVRLSQTSSNKSINPPRRYDLGMSSPIE